MSTIAYRALPGNFDWIEEIESVIEASGAKAIAEIGGGANPTLPLPTIDRLGLDYTVYDISPGELDRAPGGYRTAVADVTAPDFAGEACFDLVLSRWLLEHVADPAALHRNVHDALVPGGRAMHFFPTLYSLPFLANRVLPERLSGRVLRGADEAHSGGERGKFPALYRWCRGPTGAQISKLESTGFVVEEYTGYYGHPYYRRLGSLDRVNAAWARALARHPVARLTSFASLVLLRPAAAGR